MLRNFLKLSLRKLARQRDYALLNVLGLGLGVGCSILIFVLLRHHLSFDAYHPKADRTARIVMDVKAEAAFPFPGVPNPMAHALRTECDFVENAAMRSAEEEVLISIDNGQGSKEKYKEEGKFAWVEPFYLDILDLQVVQGSASGLSEPNTVLLAESLAKKYFADADPLGKTLRYNNELDLRVVGLLRDLPTNTDYKHNILASWATLKTRSQTARDLDSWDGARGDNYCFALLKEGHEVAELNPVMATFNTRHPHSEVSNLFNYKALPLLDLHCDTDYGFDTNPNHLWALGLIGVFLLLTACVNFVNMATALALTRGREVGVRKSLGSTKSQLFWQFMAETGLIVGASLGVGFALAWTGLPYLNRWLKEDFAFTGDLPVLLLAFSLVLGVALTFLAGFYPGLMQSRFNPVTSMRGVVEAPGKNSFTLRRALVTTQFVISQVLIIGAAVITAQMQFAQNADWGFRKGVILTMDAPEPDKLKALQTQLSQINGVKNVSLCYQPPASGLNNQTSVEYDTRPEPEQWFVNSKPVDERFLETFGLTLVAGRNLQTSDTTREYLVNETFVKKLNLASPDEILNKTIRIEGVRAPVVGVVRDYHNWDLSLETSALVFHSESKSYITCAVQLEPGNPTAVLPQIQATWEHLHPDYYYNQQFMDERMEAFLQTEIVLLRLVHTFAGIAIFIGCLGLYGLAAFMVNRKRKEVGIRKTLGATVPGILWLFGKEYARLVVVAFVVAAPLAWWAMDAWLQDYQYRISLGVGVFVVALLATAGIAAITVSVQSVKAALTNPVKSLRSE